MFSAMRSAVIKFQKTAQILFLTQVIRTSCSILQVMKTTEILGNQ